MGRDNRGAEERGGGWGVEGSWGHTKGRASVDCAFCSTSEVGFSEVLIFYVIRNGPSSTNIRVERQRNLDDPELEIQYGCPHY